MIRGIVAAVRALVSRERAADPWDDVDVVDLVPDACDACGYPLDYCPCASTEVFVSAEERTKAPELRSVANSIEPAFPEAADLLRGIARELESVAR